MQDVTNLVNVLSLYWMQSFLFFLDSVIFCIFHTIGRTDLLRCSTTQNVKASTVFLICIPEYPSFSKYICSKNISSLVSFLNLTPIGCLRYEARRNCNLKVCSVPLRDCAYWLPVRTASHPLILILFNVFHWETEILDSYDLLNKSLSENSHEGLTLVSIRSFPWLLNVLLAKAWFPKVTFQQIEKCRRFRVSNPTAQFFFLLSRRSRFF
jgi:hypothetical protein